MSEDEEGYIPIQVSGPDSMLEHLKVINLHIENGVDLSVWEKSSDEDEILGRNVEDIARVGTQWYIRKGTERVEYRG